MRGRVNPGDRDTKSLQEEWSWFVIRIPASVQAGPQPPQAPGNEACDSRGVKPKGRPSHRAEPGQGKMGRVNANEPLTRPRQLRLPEGG
jgi:hypothetical protein